MIYKLSRYWNKFAYWIIHCGRKMIWDRSGLNSYLLKDDAFVSKVTEAILTERPL